MRTTDAGEGGGAEACSAGVLGFFEVCDFCDLQSVDQLASTAASLRSDKRWRGKCDANTASVVGSDDIILGSAVSHCVDELAATSHNENLRSSVPPPI